MPGELITTTTAANCAHGARAQVVPGVSRVRVGGQPVVTVADVYTVAGCTFAPTAGNGPCVTARWVVGASRVRAGGVPVALGGSASTCVPTATPLVVPVVQPRVRGR
ncbi:hypothetical protein [Cryptosporangium sp. NPDC048952]|uniref:hypothetical protein n=1 Tax=Cryptosporangium sp. NPDC048952 TaxID=3363961 RepID=UPI0037170D2B